LLELINKDYADFVSLSANLKGIDQTIDTLRAPVQSLQQEVAAIRNSITDEMNEVRDKMARKRQLEEKRQCLTLFLDVYQTICKIEALLRVGEADPIQFRASDEDTSNLIQRVANDFNQLKYYVSRTKQFPFVQNLSGRIDRIETTMQEGLEALFCDGLVAGDRDVITNCLRTYAAIDRIQDVEDLYQHNTVHQLAAPTRRDWCHYVATHVTNRYAEWSKEMLETAQKQNNILKKYVKAAKEADGSSSGLRVDEKIAIQLSLDVEKYQEELAKLGVEPDQFEPLQTLRQCYQDNLPPQ